MSDYVRWVGEIGRGGYDVCLIYGLSTVGGICSNHLSHCTSLCWKVMFLVTVAHQSLHPRIAWEVPGRRPHREARGRTPWEARGRPRTPGPRGRTPWEARRRPRAPGRHARRPAREEGWRRRPPREAGRRPPREARRRSPREGRHNQWARRPAVVLPRGAKGRGVVKRQGYTHSF